MVIDSIESLANVTSGVVTGLQPLFEIVGLLVNVFNALPDEVQVLIGAFLGVSTTVNTVTGTFNSAIDTFNSVRTATTGLADNISDLATRYPLLAGAVGSVAAAYAGWEVGKWLGEHTALGDHTYALVEAIGEWILALRGVNDELANTNALERASGHLQDISERTGIAVTSMEEFNAAVDDGRLVFDQATQKWIAASDSMRALDDSATASAGGIKELGDGGDQASDALDTVGDSAEDAGRKANDSARGVGTLEGSLQELSKYEHLELAVSLQIAQLEADAAVAEASIESLGDTIQSTGDLLSTLFGELGNPDLGYWDRELIYEQIEKENAARQESLEMQRELTQATIDYYAARTDAISQGDSIVSVDGAGLQPHLEGFMWEILRAIQVRVNQDGLEMLLGV
jgi:hypothetical protein